jgi:3'-phosphoadenosine 5'-phosphosulfate sulfotransferase (PAPS reductase)/FAD synthetase
MFNKEKLTEAKEVIKYASDKGHLVVNFSGGKDSSAVLCLVCEMVRDGQLNPTNITVYHSDTTIEYPLLVNLTRKVLNWVNSEYGVNLIIGVAPPEKRLFATLFVVGRPVPSHFVRWCTDNLKIKPGLAAIGKEVVRLTGEHKGESQARDKRLKSCGSSECGTDRLASFVSSEDIAKPIVNWSNCAVWDYLFYADSIGLMYEGFYNHITEVYEISNDDERNTSLRMGCISCPVVNTSRAYDTDKKGVPSNLSLKLRLIFEAMRGDENRVRNPRPPKNGTRQMGALALPIRRYYWEIVKQLNEDFKTIDVQLMCDDEITFVEQSLAAGRYPQTYKPEVIPSLENEWLERSPEWMKQMLRGTDV